MFFTDMVKLFPFKDIPHEEKENIFSFHPDAPVWFYMQKIYEIVRDEYHYETLNAYSDVLDEVLKGLKTRIRNNKIKELDNNYARKKFTSQPAEYFNNLAEEKFVDTIKRCVKIWRAVMQHTEYGKGMSDEKLIQIFFTFAKEGPYQLPKTHRYILGSAPTKRPTSLVQQKNGAGSLLIKVLHDFVPRDINKAQNMWNREKNLIKNSRDEYKETDSSLLESDTIGVQSTPYRYYTRNLGKDNPNIPGAGYIQEDGEILPPNISLWNTKGNFHAHDDSPFD